MGENQSTLRKLINARRERANPTQKGPRPGFDPAIFSLKDNCSTNWATVVRVRVIDITLTNIKVGDKWGTTVMHLHEKYKYDFVLFLYIFYRSRSLFEFWCLESPGNITASWTVEFALNIKSGNQLMSHSHPGPKLASEHFDHVADVNKIQLYQCQGPNTINAVSNLMTMINCRSYINQRVKLCTSVSLLWG